MALNVDEKWVRDFCVRTGQKLPKEMCRNSNTSDAAQARSKYGNQSTEADGKRFASRHEAKAYERLRLECIAGLHIGLACQVAFYLPGGVKYIADFVSYEPDGTYRVYDAKSEATSRDKVYRIKKRQMKNCLGIDIEEI